MKLPQDKVDHFIAGCAIALLSCIIFSVFYKPIYTFYISMGMVSLAGLGKELYDYYHPENHTADIFDALATLAGGFCVSYVAMVLCRL